MVEKVGQSCRICGSVLHKKVAVPAELAVSVCVGGCRFVRVRVRMCVFVCVGKYVCVCVLHVFVLLLLVLLYLLSVSVCLRLPTPVDGVHPDHGVR